MSDNITEITLAAERRRFAAHFAVVRPSTRPSVRPPASPHVLVISRKGILITANENCLNGTAKTTSTPAETIQAPHWTPACNVR